MSYFSWSDIDLSAGGVVVAKILTINHDDMTATVEGISGNIPIHYHCDQTGNTDTGESWEASYPDSIDEGGSQAFSVNDEVLVMFRREGNISPVIVGFKGESQSCCGFRFYLEGESSGELTENVSFLIYNEDQVSQPITDLEYDEDQGCWVFKIDTSQEGASCEGPFWAKYLAAGFKPTQYHGVTENFFGEESRVVLGDGTLYSDLLEKLTGEIGYWEDWAEGICGKNDWSISNSQIGIRVPCPSMSYEVYNSNSTAYFYFNIDNNCLVFYTWGTFYTRLSTIQIKKPVTTKMIIKMEADVTIPSTIDESPLVCIILNELIYLCIFGYDDYPEIGGLPENVFDVGFLADGKKYELLLSDYGIGSDFETSGISSFVFETRTGKATTSEGGEVSIAHGYIDYIDFPRWESWDDSDEPNFCKNNIWAVHAWATYPHNYYMYCPIDFEDEKFALTNTTLSLDEGVLSGSVESVIDGTGSAISSLSIIYGGDELEDSVTVLRIKVTAEAIADDPYSYTSFVGLYIGTVDGGEDYEQWFALAYGNRFIIDEWNWIDLSDQTGEVEIEINLMEYGLAGKIYDIELWAYANGATGNTANFTCDYIDLI